MRYTASITVCRLQPLNSIVRRNDGIIFVIRTSLCNAHHSGIDRVLHITSDERQNGDKTAINVSEIPLLAVSVH